MTGFRSGAAIACRAGRGLVALAFLALATASHAGAEHGVERVLIEKGARRLTLLDAEGGAVRVYDHIRLGWEPVGPKRFEGDGRTPEGHYRIDWGLESSAYHLSLHISYPGPSDQAYARSRGRSPGGAIFIHGWPNGARDAPEGDWTAGCIALDNAEIEEIWGLVGDGTPVDIVA
ncbi:ErfK/YbiS/YcfS/YnhG [Novosphingobium nitrogenifigens DSM 19370]|uniref:ErfK/YbiS/YcfS/YnhG n=1 Tax=Novosphingobium nitrogenifigens DSM 19370 TaxID=983920 RepID=F1ZCY1_9SPHN|nr:L,D-transpeptidase family protein [Novosphingobium nitrogenifigens]EGD57532.1 ErfK/YbiS/YcfS/YnhG [Novosphingobium nitrogenifigens DSM 19370]